MTSMAAPNRKPVITARDRNCEIQLIRSRAITRNRTPVAIAMAATRSVAAWSLVTAARATAEPATAASDELGPIESWRDVPKIA